MIDSLGSPRIKGVLADERNRQVSLQIASAFRLLESWISPVVEIEPDAVWGTRDSDAKSESQRYEDSNNGGS